MHGCQAAGITAVVTDTDMHTLAGVMDMDMEGTATLTVGGVAATEATHIVAGAAAVGVMVAGTIKE